MKAKTKKRLRAIDWFAVTLLMAGGLNWGLVGFLNYDLVRDILPMLAKYVYMIVGLGFVWIAYRSLMKSFMK
jgi:hypothetical protein